MNEPFLAHSEITNEIYIIYGKKKYCVTDQAISAMKATGRLNERPQGEWLTNMNRGFFNPGRKCSLCGKVVEFSENFCPKCGADMRGNKND